MSIDHFVIILRKLFLPKNFFLIVSTLEPRKNHINTIKGFRTYLDTLTTEQKRENIIKIFEEVKIEYTDIEIDKFLQQENADKNSIIVSEKFNEVSKLTHKRIQNIEFITLVLDTFIWGYGDLIDKIEFKSSTPIEHSKQNEDKNVSK